MAPKDGIFHDPKKRRSYLLAVGATIALLGLIVIYALEFRYFNLLLSPGALVLRSLIAGLLPGIMAGIAVSRRVSGQLERVQIIIFIAVLTCIFMPLFTSLANRWLAYQPLRFESVELEREEPFFADRFGLIEGEQPEPTGYFLFFYRHGRLHRIRYDQALFTGRARGEYITLPLQRGFLGFDLAVPAAGGRSG